MNGFEWDGILHPLHVLVNCYIYPYPISMGFTDLVVYDGLMMLRVRLYSFHLAFQDQAKMLLSSVLKCSTVKQYIDICIVKTVIPFRGLTVD